MKSRQSNIYLWLVASLVGMIGTLIIQPAWAQVKAQNNTQKASFLQQSIGWNGTDFKQQLPPRSLTCSRIRGAKSNALAPRHQIYIL